MTFRWRDLFSKPETVVEMGTEYPFLLLVTAISIPYEGSTHLVISLEKMGYHAFRYRMNDL